MRICHINLAKTFGGGERQTELLIRELADRGWPQRLVVRESHELVERCSELPNLEIVECAGLLSAGRATKGSTLVHAHEARGVYAGWFARVVYGIPYILTRRVTRRQKSSWLRNRAYRTAGVVAAVSAAVAAHLRETYPDIDSVVIPDAYAELPVDAEVAVALRGRYEDKILIGHVGSYDHSVKGQLTIIEVARRAQEEQPDWHFLLLGAGKDEELFRQRIGDLTNIELVGFVDNVGDYLSAFDVFVFPSLHEALGSSVLDAMRFGLPVVATRVGGIPEIVKEGVNGILIKTESADQLMKGITAIVADEEWAGRMHLENRARAANFSPERMADAYEAIYRKLL